jgi:cyclophilin family peptidyl-prolyl cis-trans isomerase/HEAT repeat protein
MIKSADKNLRRRAALAAGRIGDENAIPFLIELLEKDVDKNVRLTATFALGEIESIKASDAILNVLRKTSETIEVRARAIEAAGKIAAVNAEKNLEKSAELGKAIFDAVNSEFSKPQTDRETVLLGITAILRAKPNKGDVVLAKSLADKDARVRGDALNAIARLQSKNENAVTQAQTLLTNDQDAIVRANSARLLGAAEDAKSIDLIIKTAATDADERVRVSAIRALANLKDKKAAAPLLERGEKLIAAYKTAKTNNVNPTEKNELLEIVTSLGKLLAGSEDSKASAFLISFWGEEGATSPEVNIALAKVSSSAYVQRSFSPVRKSLDWKRVSVTAQAIGELVIDENVSKIARKGNEGSSTIPGNVISDYERVRGHATSFLNYFVGETNEGLTKLSSVSKAIPDVLRAYTKFKPDNLLIVLREHLKHKDAIVRANAAELLGEQPGSKENILALQKSFDVATANDKEMNDAQLAILSALVKLDKKQALSALITALNSPDFLVRRHAATLIKPNDLARYLPNVDEKVGTVKAYNQAYKTKLGQILNTDADYVRAISRRNGSAKAIITTEKGDFTIVLLPEDAPLTVDNFVKLANSNYFNNTDFHRVVSNFVVQGGDPRGDGNGGPGYQIRDEINTVPYERGTVGMALSGKDTGGSQWFVTHSPQPHLDGGYTVFGRINESGMKIVDKISRGDRILSIKIIESDLSLKLQNEQKK